MATDPLQGWFSLEGQTAFVTGAGQGLGAAIARGLAQAGARVVLADVVSTVEDVALALRDDGADCVAMKLDVREEPAFVQVFDAAVARYGAIDVMINNAARTPSTSIWSISPEEWDDVLAINLRGGFFGCRIAGRHMRERGSGRIVNVASIAGQQSAAGTAAHYAASKAGLISLTRSFAQTLAPHGVTVNALAPSAVHSPLLDSLEPARRQTLQSSIPLGRFGAADEVAAAVVFLASPAAGYITGATLDLNGGRLMR